MVIEVGERISIPNAKLRRVCEGEEACKDVIMELGKLYVARGEVEGKLPEDPGTTLWEVLKSIRKEYPGVSITYIWVSDDGRKFEIHLFDPESRLLFWKIVIIIALIIGLLLAASHFLNISIDAFERFWEAVSPYIPKPPPMPQTPWFWWVLLAIGGSIAVAGLIRAIRGK